MPLPTISSRTLVVLSGTSEVVMSPPKC
jgi:hypothetical protein